MSNNISSMPFALSSEYKAAYLAGNVVDIGLSDLIIIYTIKALGLQIEIHV